MTALPDESGGRRTASLDTAAHSRRVLFRMVTNDIVREEFPAYAVSPDGQRFVLNTPATPEPLTLIQIPPR